VPIIAVLRQVTYAGALRRVNQIQTQQHEKRTHPSMIAQIALSNATSAGVGWILDDVAAHRAYVTAFAAATCTPNPGMRRITLLT
jgi:hypothetical protein